MTSISIEFQSIPMRIGDNGFEYGDSDRAVCHISLTAFVEAESREEWSVDRVYVWLADSTAFRFEYESLDRDSDLFRDIKTWLENDDNARDKINDYVALAILPSGRIVGGDGARV